MTNQIDTVAEIIGVIHDMVNDEQFEAFYIHLLKGFTAHPKVRYSKQALTRKAKNQSRSGRKRFGVKRDVHNDITSKAEQFQSLLLSKNFRFVGGTRSLDKIAAGIVNFASGKDVPDSGQEHLANGDDGFLVTPVRLDAAITLDKFRVILGIDESVSDLNKKRLQAAARLGNTGRLDMLGASVVSGTAASPGNEMLG